MERLLCRRHIARYVKQFLAVVSFNPPSAHSRWWYHPHFEELRLREVKDSCRGGGGS